MSAHPEQVGPYTIDREIGRGGMGVVYLGHDTKLDRPVAIKSLPGHLAGDAERLSRFQREARLLASLSHPNIAAVYGLEEHDGAHYLVMEFVEGENLAQMIARAPLAAEEAIRIGVQVAGGVEAAHEAGVIHRDLKPGNIVVTPQGKAKVLDFGLAKETVGRGSSMDLSQSPTMTRGQQTAHTAVGQIVGTAAYLSPEQARGKALDRRTDIWSFGCVLFECLTGGSPYLGETATDSIGAILHKDPEWSRLPPQTPPTVRLLLKRCLTRDPERRLRDIGDARVELEDAISGQSSSSLSLAEEALAQGGPRVAARGGLLVFIVGVAGIAIGAIAGMRLLTPGGPVRSESAGSALRFNIGAPGETRISDDSFLTAIDLSPIGDGIAFVADTDGTRRIYIQRFDEFDPVVLADTVGAEQPEFSPDGRWIAFFADSKLKRISTDGGPAMIICEAPSPRGLSWVNNDLIVFTPEQITPLMTIPASGGDPTSITEMHLDGAEYSHRHPTVLPGGDTILYSRAAGSEWDTVDIWAHTLSTGEDKRVMTGGAQVRYSPSGHLVHYLGGALVATPFDINTLETTGPPSPLGHSAAIQTNTGAAQFDVGSGGTIAFVAGGLVGASNQLVKVSLEGEVTPLSPDLRAFRMPRLSPDGSKIAIASIAQGRGDLFVFDMARDIWTRQTFSGSVEAAWSPDGERIYYADSTSGAWDIYIRPIAGGAPTTIIKDIGFAPLLSAVVLDEDKLIFTIISNETRDDLMIAELDGDTWNTRPLLNQPYAETGGEISPDGKWLAYASDELGRFDVYVTDFPECRQKRQVSVDGGSEPVWSRDGKTLYFRYGPDMMASTIETDGGFTASRPTFLFSTPYEGLIATGAASFDVLPDGEGFVMSRPVAQNNTAPRISVILNWASSMQSPD